MELKLSRPAARFALLSLAGAIALLPWRVRTANETDRVATEANQAAEAPSQRSFAADVARLSEPGGEFDTDNLVSNERSYLEVVSALQQTGVSGGCEQNRFTARDHDGVLVMRGEASVCCAVGPAILIQRNFARACSDDRLDGDDQALGQFVLR